MAIVSFENIHRITMDQVTAINATGAAGVTTDTTRPTLYDPTWGYFIFGQGVTCNYEEDNTYQDLATFTIQGQFTRNAEGCADQTDEQAFQALVAKFEALESLFEEATRAKAPESYGQWGGSSDPRCIPLPKPLVDDDSKVVYGLPTSFRIDKTLFPNEIRYSAVLREAKFPMCKLVVNEYLLDDAVININLPTPVLAEHQIVGTSGEVLQLKYYKSMEVEVSGTMPLIEANRAVSDDMKAMAASLELGKLELSLGQRTISGVDTSVIWNPLDIVDDPQIDIDYLQQKMTVSVKARQ